MKAKTDARICDHTCDRLASRCCRVCERDTCVDHGTWPVIQFLMSAGRELKFPVIDVIMCHKCIERLQTLSLTQAISGDEAHIDPDLRKGAAESLTGLIVNLRAFLSRKDLAGKGMGAG